MKTPPITLSQIQAWYKANRSHYPLVNQNPQEYTSMTTAQQRQVSQIYLPILVYLWAQVETATGHKWMATSYLRTSPSHSRGYALDIAPDIAPHDASKYAVYNGSDPVLYKREALLRQLQLLARAWNAYAAFDLPYSVSYAVEPDHIHLSLFSTTEPHARVLKWGGPKDAYADTASRSQLPLIKKK